MRKIFFGGSFNPIHHGHLICSRAVAETLGFDRIVLVPTAQPPHKQHDRRLASPAERLAMCQQACAGDRLFQVDDLELNRPGPSYTIDTIHQLRQRGEGQIFWLIGADMLEIFPQWHKPEQLMQSATFLIMARPGWTFDFAKLPPAFRGLGENVVQAPLLQISATEIRQRVAAGKSIDYLVPPAVLQYINRHNLYK